MFNLRTFSQVSATVIKPYFLILYCRFSKSEGSVFPDYLEVATAVVVSVFLPMHRYSVDIFSYSSPSGILGSVGKQNTA